MKASNGNDSLAIVSYDPPLPAKFKLEIAFQFLLTTIGSVDRAQIFARPYTEGKDTDSLDTVQMITKRKWGIHGMV